MSQVFTKKQSFTAWVIFGQAILAMFGSLYFSNYGDPVFNLMELGALFPFGTAFEPCQLCWWARILMYPIVLISAVGIWQKDKNFVNFVLPLASAGILLEMYHYALQKLPIDTSFGCTSAVPCSALDLNYFGFITIPFLCLVAFLVIFIASLLFKRD
jgi:disulfide bond formation protein DsbB